MVLPFQNGRMPSRTSARSASDMSRGSHARVLTLSNSAPSQPDCTSGKSCAARGRSVGPPTMSSPGAISIGNSVKRRCIACPQTETSGSPWCSRCTCVTIRARVMSTDGLSFSIRCRRCSTRVFMRCHLMQRAGTVHAGLSPAAVQKRITARLPPPVRRVLHPPTFMLSFRPVHSPLLAYDCSRL